MFPLRPIGGAWSKERYRFQFGKTSWIFPCYLLICVNNTKVFWTAYLLHVYFNENPYMIKYMYYRYLTITLKGCGYCEKQYELMNSCPYCLTDSIQTSHRFTMGERTPTVTDLELHEWWEFHLWKSHFERSRSSFHKTWHSRSDADTLMWG